MIDVSVIDAAVTVAGNQAFRIMQGGFTNGGQLRIIHQGDTTLIGISINDAPISTCRSS